MISSSLTGFYSLRLFTFFCFSPPSFHAVSFWLVVQIELPADQIRRGRIMFLSQTQSQKALVLLENGECGYSSPGNWLRDSCSFFHTSSLTLLFFPLLLLGKNSGLDYCQDQNDEVQHFPCQPALLFVVDKVPLWHMHF